MENTEGESDVVHDDEAGGEEGQIRKSNSSTNVTSIPLHKTPAVPPRSTTAATTTQPIRPGRAQTTIVRYPTSEGIISPRASTLKAPPKSKPAISRVPVATWTKKNALQLLDEEVEEPQTRINQLGISPRGTPLTQETESQSRPALTSSQSNPALTKQSSLKPCHGVPIHEYGPLYEVLCDLLGQQNCGANFDKEEEGKWKPVYAPNCTGKSDKSDGRCPSCRQWVEKADKLVKKRASKKHIKVKKAEKVDDKKRNNTLKKHSRRPSSTVSISVTPSSSSSTPSSASTPRKLTTQKSHTDWSGLTLPENLGCKDNMLRTIKSALLALQLNQYAMQEILGNIDKQSKYQQINPYITKETYHHLDSIFVTQHYFLDAQRKLKSVITVQKLARTWFARRRFLQLRATYIISPLYQRNRVFRELVKKEKAYGENLALIIEEFLLPLRELEKKKRGIMTDDEINSVFINIEEINQAHLELLLDLLNLQEHWPNVDGIGSLFLKRAASFSAYGKYTLLFKTASEVLSKVLQRDKVSHFIEQKGQKTRDINGMDLQTLITLPLNVISDYHLILERLLQSTSASSPDRESLDQAFLLMKKTAKFLQSCLEKAENQARIFAANQKIKKTNLLNFENGDEYIYVREGKAHVDTPKNKKYKAYVFVFRNELILCKYAKKAPYTFVERISLENKAQYEDSKGPPSNKTKACFDIVNAETRVTLAWKDAQELKQWKDDIEEQLAHHQKHRVFGVDITTVELDPKLQVPSVMVMLVQHLRVDGIDAQGVFRESGTQKSVAELKELLDKGQITLANLKDHPPLSVAAVVKMYFRLLPEPLLTFNLYEPFLAAKTNFEDAALVNEIKALLKRLPAPNYKLLEFLMEFLHEVSEHSDTNKMRPSNIAICFSPNLLRPKVETIDYNLNITKITAIVEIMVDRFGEIFKNQPPKLTLSMISTKPLVTPALPVKIVTPRSDDEEEVSVEEWEEIEEEVEEEEEVDE